MPPRPIYKVLLPTAALVLLTALTITGQQAPPVASLFRGAVTYPSGGKAPVSIAVADLNGDGTSDLVLANANSDTVGVLVGNGDGTFQASVTYASGGHSPNWVVVADLNADGKPDLVVANGCATTCTNGVVSVLLGNGDGTFQAAMSYGSGGGIAWSVAVADVNGDRKLDLVVTNQNDNTVGVLLGNGDGTFQTALIYGYGRRVPHLSELRKRYDRCLAR